mmetsp:Transcript_8109/g.11261  ORF Transcript_8109/g.11261 Transcript_8109/m.11261 type:complete len:92 (-) Transcript_8109:84-359(-)
MTDLGLLRALLHEITTFIELHRIQLLADGNLKEAERILETKNMSLSRGSRFDDKPDTPAISQMLKRFRLINPAQLLATIRNCESLGLITTS